MCAGVAAAALVVVSAAAGRGAGDEAMSLRVRIKGTPQVGRRLIPAFSPRRFAGRPSYRWFVCWWTGDHCRAIAGATHASYLVRAGDVGRSLVLEVRVRGRRRSPPTAVVVPRSAPVIAAAGDVACAPGGAVGPDTCREAVTSEMILRAAPTAVLPLGDLQYECGRTSEFSGSYAKSWGRFQALSHPVLGNHEYGQACGANDASPYFRYFGREAGAFGKGWYSYEVGSWHVVALNSECAYGAGKARFGACAANSRQAAWLRADLDRHKNRCTLAYWHEPRFSSGRPGDAQLMAPIWNIVVRAHVDLVLAGHAHDYERFLPLGVTPGQQQPPAGAPSFQQPVLDANGTQEIVVGTGGKDHGPFTAGPLAGEVVRNADTFGFLSITLRRGSYDWRFVAEPGKTFSDSGSATCR